MLSMIFSKNCRLLLTLLVACGLTALFNLFFTKAGEGEGGGGGGPKDLKYQNPLSARASVCMHVFVRLLLCVFVLMCVSWRCVRWSLLVRRLTMIVSLQGKVARRCSN